MRLDGETWDARCAAGASPGDEVRITGRDKLTLVVDRVEPASQLGLRFFPLGLDARHALSRS